MKVLVVQFEDTVDITPLVKGTGVSVKIGTITLPGVVMFSTDILDPPGLEGLYHISPVETP